MHRIRHRVGAVLLTGALLAAMAGCGDDDEPAASTSTTTASSSTTTAPASSSLPASSSTEVPVEHTEVRAYFLREEKVGPVGREATDEAVATSAVEELLIGPTEDERQLGFSSAIPEGTELLGIVIEDGVATVDLSDEFGSGGGSASMTGRVAQVVFTLTQFSTVESVLFEIEGEPVSALGGEGVLLEDPQTRSDWEDLAPAILVESPLPFAEAASPLRIVGTANTFEAVFRVNVTDGEGLIVYDEPAMASSGTGTRGTFDITVEFEVPRPGIGAVIVFEESAQDGRPINIIEIPIRLSP